VHETSSKSDNFYRATSMYSADYAVARCPSVCHTPVLCLNDYTYPHFFHRWIAHHSSSPTPNGMAIFWRGPPNRGAECKGYEKITIFDQYLALSRKWCKQDGAMVTKTVPDRAIFTMADQWKVVYGVSNSANFNDVEQPLTQFLRSRFTLTLNIS